MKLDSIISNICIQENMTEDNFKQFIKSYEKYIKSEIKKYDDNNGLEDFKMNKGDYKILYELYSKTGNTPHKIYILLLYMYSFYKLDGIDFDTNKFPLKIFLKFLKNNDNIHGLIFKLVTENKNEI
jgi:hypothetical protein